jgi:putative transposase
MKRTWSIEQKVSILKEAETTGVVETCRKHGIYATTYYDWKRKFDQGGVKALEPGYSKREQKDIRKLEKENERLKKMLAERDIEIQIKTELLKKKMEQWKNAKR